MSILPSHVASQSTTLEPPPLPHTSTSLLWKQLQACTETNISSYLGNTSALQFPFKIVGGSRRKKSLKLVKFFCAWMNNRKAKPWGLWGGTLSLQTYSDVLGR